MKLKYFLRGLGLGIFVTAGILFISHKAKEETVFLTDEQIIQSAEELGMVMKEEQSETPKPSEAPKSSETPKSSEAPTPSEAPKPSETPKSSETPTPSETPKPSDESSLEEETLVSVTIKEGMWSEQVARIMNDKGLVADKTEFNRYLINNGYSSSISVGTYEIPIGATYHEIAEKITK